MNFQYPEEIINKISRKVYLGCILALRDGKAYNSQIRRHINCEAASSLRALQVLEADGVVRRLPYVKKDCRKVWYVLTDKGEEICTMLNGLIEAYRE